MEDKYTLSQIFEENLVDQVEAEAIIIDEKFKNGDIIEKFEHFRIYKNEHGAIVESFSEFSLKKGDRILFLNGYGIPMITEILGFNHKGDAYLLWDCYWFPINVKERLIKKL